MFHVIPQSFDKKKSLLKLTLSCKFHINNTKKTIPKIISEFVSSALLNLSQNVSFIICIPVFAADSYFCVPVLFG